MSPRRWRFLAALCVCGVFAASVLRHDGLSIPARRALVSSQLTPALAAFGPLLAVVAGILVLTLLFGRVYCSVLCPAGIVQDMAHRLGGLLRLRRLAYVRPIPALIMPAVAGLAAMLGIATLGNFLDPVGLFGRLTALGGGVAAVTAPTAAGFLLLAGACLLLVVPLFRGRWFCDRLCPAGALMAMAAGAIPGRRVTMDAGACVSCGRCESRCPVRAIDATEKRVDTARCVLCLDCLDACPTRALSYRKTAKAAVEQPRRTFLHSTAAAAAGGLFVVGRPLARLFGGDHGVEGVLPPGAGTALNHRSRCVSCQLCVAACPVGIIRTERADLRPTLDFDHGYCQYGCTLCSQSCPAGALTPLSMEEKQCTRLARTAFHPDRCVAIALNMACGACAEVCPTHAVRMAERGEGLPTAPDFAVDHCIGCGACYHVCPVDPRAFSLEGLARQERSAGVRPGGHAADAASPGAVDGDELQDFPF